MRFARATVICAALCLLAACRGEPNGAAGERAGPPAAGAPGPRGAEGGTLPRPRPAGGDLPTAPGLRDDGGPVRRPPLPGRSAGIPDAPPVGPSRPWTISPIRGELRRALVPRNWRPGCPVALDDLRWLTVAYRGFDGRRRVGPIVVHEAVAGDVRWAFRQLYRAGFPIERVALPRRFRDLPRSETWDDTRNVTSGFNCRPVTDGTSWSQHAYGLAIDINPLQNPYVRGNGSVLRRAARPYRDRSLDRPGMIREGDVVVRAFDAIGWEWGGRWRTLKDYMHFSATGG